MISELIFSDNKIFSTIFPIPVGDIRGRTLNILGESLKFYK